QTIIFLYFSLLSLSFLSSFASFLVALFSLSVPYSCLFYLVFLFLFHVQGVVMLRVFLHDFHIFLLFFLYDFYFVLFFFRFLFFLFPFLIDPSLLSFHISYLVLELPFLSLMCRLTLLQMEYFHQ